MSGEQARIEKLIQGVYKKWKNASQGPEAGHPDEETIACFLEGRLSGQEEEDIKTHLISCDVCAESLAFQLSSGRVPERGVPPALLAYVKDLVRQKEATPVLDILLKIKDNFLEILNTTGDVLVGQELMAVSILRSRRIKEFKDEVLVLKEFQDIRVEARIKNEQGKAFSLAVTVKDKTSQKLMRDLRITLFRQDKKLKSHLTDSGRAVFRHVLLGKYKVEIATRQRKLALILLDIET